VDFSKTAEVLVHERSSRRSFRDEPISAAHRDVLDAEMARFTREGGALGTVLRFELIAASRGDSEALRGLHTYGFIKNPAGFIVGTVESGDKDLEDYGRALEMIVLRATELGIGTCWLGGTFNRSRFAERVGLKDQERMPAVIALGYPTHSRGAVEKIIRWGAGAKKRKPWSTKFWEGRVGVPLERDGDAWWEAPLELVRLAPSSSNKQPVQVVRDGQRFHFVLARSPGYARNMRAMGLADLQRVDVGIAMCHFELGASDAGREGRWLVLNPELGELPESVQYAVSWEPT
jgi:nitroreductase